MHLAVRVQSLQTNWSRGAISPCLPCQQQESMYWYWAVRVRDMSGMCAPACLHSVKDFENLIRLLHLCSNCCDLVSSPSLHLLLSNIIPRYFNSTHTTFYLSKGLCCLFQRKVNCANVHVQKSIERTHPHTDSNAGEFVSGGEFTNYSVVIARFEKQKNN